MKHILSLDIGKRRTGIAYADIAIGIPLPLETAEHTSIEELDDHVQSLIQERNIDTLIVGLPYLPSGDEGEQSQYVRWCMEQMNIPSSVQIEYLDERYTTPKSTEIDQNAAAACTILEMYIRQEK